jgi:Cytochrome P450
VDEALVLRNSPKDAESGQHSQYIFLNELAKETDDREELRDQILNVLLAGRDTTASLLSNMFWELARHPEIYDKLREEISVLKGREPTYEELKDMRYLRFCLNECLSSAPLNFNVANMESSSSSTRRSCEYKGSDTRYDLATWRRYRWPIADVCKEGDPCLL